MKTNIFLLSLAVSGSNLFLSGCGSDHRNEEGKPTKSIETSTANLAPTVSYGVGTEIIQFSRTDADGIVRSLPTKIFYPATSSGVDKPIADGKFPLILFSHGSGGTYDTYPGPIGYMVQAGFIVAAPEYPHSKKSAPLDIQDALKGNQSLDASQVITNMLARDTTVGDRFFGHFDTSKGVAAAGHSLGGLTTHGLLGKKRDDRITSAIIYAGGSLGTVKGAPVKVFFQHGDDDPTSGLSYASTKNVYNAILATWPKAFLTHIAGGHWEYLWPSGPTYVQTWKTSVDWLRWSMYEDPNALARLPDDAANTKTKWEAANVAEVKIEAESYASMSGVVPEVCSEGGLDIGSIEAGDSMSYTVNVPIAGNYTVEYRVASLRGGAVLQLDDGSDNKIFGSINVPKTDGWQNWTTVSNVVSLTSGTQTLRIKGLVRGANVNWFKIKQ